jgi:dimethylargininase
MRVFDFTRAIVRKPAPSAVDGLRADMSQTPDYPTLCVEHVAYIAALRALGLEVTVLPQLPAFPDSVFVEDPALTFPEGAIVLRPGAPSRTAEAEHMRAALASRFPKVLALEPDEFTDGGDVLVTPQAVLVGLSARTTAKGAAALKTKLAELGRDARICQTPQGVLHFKTVVSLVAEDAVLATPAMAASDFFPGYRVFVTPEGEESAANAVRINDTMLVGAEYPRTIDMLQNAGIAVQALSVRETAKLDAGLSCMSLRW